MFRARVRQSRVGARIRCRPTLAHIGSARVQPDAADAHDGRLARQVDKPRFVGPHFHSGLREDGIHKDRFLAAAAPDRREIARIRAC